MRKQIPNIITLCNLFSGCIASVMAFHGNFREVVIWVIIAAIFDFLDGFAARLLKAYSPLGKELDSLADMVSFGVAPAIAVFILLQDSALLSLGTHQIVEFLPYLAFLIPVFSAYRLAKFNLDTRQTTSFIGLPTPANGLFWISYCYGMNELFADKHYYIYLTLGLIIVLSLLMISEIPMFSLKIKKFSFKENAVQIALIAIMISLVITLGISGIAWGILAYIFLSFCTQKKGI